MNNYEYIIASLPVLHEDYRLSTGLDADSLIGEIRAQLGARDREYLEQLLKLFDGIQLDAELYSSAMDSRQNFIKGYFAYDLALRNAKVNYLNRELGREPGLDLVILDPDADMETDSSISDVLERKDILERERGLDDLLWEKIEALTLMHVFDIDVILGFVARLKIVDRWLKLDPETGRELFRKLVEEIRNNK